jgi:hypothetical protein
MMNLTIFDNAGAREQNGQNEQDVNEHFVWMIEIIGCQLPNA